MNDHDKTKPQLIAELQALRRRVAELEESAANRGRAEAAVAVAEQEQMAAELARSRAVLQAAVECLPFEFFALDQDGRYILQNGTLREHYGNVVGQRPEDCAPDEATRRLWLDNNRRAYAGERVEGEVEFRVGDKSRQYHNIITPIRDDRAIYGILGVNVEITERKRAEAALQQAHDELERRVEQRTVELTKANEELSLYRKFVEASGEGFGMCDLEGRITYNNPTLRRLFGEQKSEDVVGKHVSTYYPEEFLAKLRAEMMPALLNEGRWQVEQTVQLPEGKTITVFESLFLIRDEAGNPFRIAAVVSDITERKRAEAALAESEAKLKTLFQMLPVGISILDAERRIVEFNPALERILGMTAEGLLRGDFVRRQYLRSDGSPIPFDEFPSVRVLKTGAEVSDVEIGVVKEDGGVVWTSVSAAPLPLPGLSAALAVIDITERRAAQKALEREHHTLRQLLQASDHERQLIAYEIHDELAQLLTGAIMQLQMYEHLRKAKPKEAALALQAGVTMLQQSHAEARRLISGVRPPILDEAGIVAAVAHLVNEQRREKGPIIEYHSRVEFERLNPILENAIYRIVQEALANAFKHSKCRKTFVALLQEVDAIRVEVRDDGVGFSVDAVDQSRFGLSGIRERVRVFGGRASIDSAPGKGTHIIAELPLMLKD